MKKMGVWLIAAIMLLTSVTPVFAESSTATSMRLLSTEGTVKLTNQNGKSLSVREDMKLYSGYKLKTGAASYAYINLDDKKAIKLDASTKVEIRKSKKKLQVLVSSGKLFFNVSAPLAEDEKMEVRTSTIVTGIRGTSGIVDYVDENTSSLSLLDGKVTLQAVDPASGEQVSVAVEAGQTATVSREVAQGTAAAPGAPKVSVVPLTEKGVPGFAATEIRKDAALQKKIAEQSGLDVKAVVEKAADTLVQEQKAAEQVQKQVAQAVEELKASDQVAVFDLSGEGDKPSAGASTGSSSGSSSGGGSGNSSGGSSGGSGDISGNEPPASSDHLTGSSITMEQVKGAMELHQKVTLQPDGVVAIDGELEIPVGKELVLDSTSFSGALSIASDSELTVSGLLTIRQGDVIVASGGAIVVKGSLVNNGEVQNNSTVQAASGFIDSANGTWSNGTNSFIKINKGCVALKDTAEISGIQDGEGNPSATALLQAKIGTARYFAASLNDVLACKTGDCTVQIETAGPTLLSRNLAVASGRRITLDINGQMLNVTAQNGGADPRIINNGELQIMDSSETKGEINMGSGAVTNNGTMTVTGGSRMISSTSQPDVHATINNKGTLTVSDNGQVFGEQCAIKNSNGTVRITSGGAVSSRYCGISNQVNAQGSVCIEAGATVELVVQGEKYAIDGVFTLDQGAVVRAKASENLCSIMPDGWKSTEDEDKGWFYLERS